MLPSAHHFDALGTAETKFLPTFLGLPQELLDMIYDELWAVFPEDQFNFCCEGEGWSIKSEFSACRLAFHPSYAHYAHTSSGVPVWLLTCKKVSSTAYTTRSCYRLTRLTKSIN